jgi:hypothetical protein
LREQPGLVRHVQGVGGQSALRGRSRLSPPAATAGTGLASANRVSAMRTLSRIRYKQRQPPACRNSAFRAAAVDRLLVGLSVAGARQRRPSEWRSPCKGRCRFPNRLGHKSPLRSCLPDLPRGCPFCRVGQISSDQAPPGIDAYRKERNYGNANQHEQHLQAAVPVVRADANPLLYPVHFATPADTTP